MVSKYLTTISNKKLKYTDQINQYLLIILAVITLNLYCYNIQYNADTLFPYRYINGLFSENTPLLIIQPGSRIFPEWLYSAIGYIFSKNPTIWLRTVIFVNSVALALSLLFLFIKLTANKNLSFVFATFALLIIPIMGLIHQNSVKYLLFSPGMHGFSVPYVLICMAVFFENLIKKTSLKNIRLFIFICGVITAFDQSIIVTLCMPLFALVLVWFFLKRISINKTMLLLLSILVSMIAGAILSGIIVHFSGHVFLVNDFSFFSIDLMAWLGSNTLLSQLYNRKAFGYFLEVFVVSQFISIFSLYYFRKSNPCFALINVFHLLCPLIYIAVLFVINQDSTRWVPLILLLSPLMIIVNAYLLLQSQNVTFKKPKVKLIQVFVFILAFISVFSLTQLKTKIIKYSNVEKIIVDLIHKNKIKGVGLSDYWISNAIVNKPFNLLPIKSNGYPYLFAINANDFINPDNLLIDFIVNIKNNNKINWTLNENDLTHIFGKWTEFIDVVVGKFTYRVYLYPSGINSIKFYNQYKRELSSLIKT